MKTFTLVVHFLLALGFLAMANNVSGVTVTESLTVTVSGGPYDGVVGTGSFSYDDTELIVGDEILNPSSTLEIDLTLFGQMFIEADDVDFPGLPSLEFDSFVPFFLDYVIAESGDNPVEIDEPTVAAINIIDFLTPASGGGFEATAFITLIPEPSSLLLGALASLGLLMRRRRLS